MSNAIGSSHETNPTRMICKMRAILLDHVPDIMQIGLFINSENTFLGAFLVPIAKKALDVSQ